MLRESKDKSPEVWLQYARADLAMARIDLPPEATWELLCFHTQQAAEKAIKALMLHLGIEFPYTHNIQLLVSMLPADFQTNPVFIDAAALTTYAVMARYPGEIPPVSGEDYESAVQ